MRERTVPERKNKDKIGISARITKEVWDSYDYWIEENYGRYKKSEHLESLISKFLENVKNKRYL